MILMPMPILGWFWVVAWAIAKALIVTAVATGVSYLIGKKNQSGLKPAGAEDWDVPTATEVRPMPLVSGTRDVSSPNAISPIFDFHRRHKKRHGQTVAWYYSFGLHWGICNAHVDGIVQYGMGDDVVWPVVSDPDSFASDGQTSIVITDAFTLWGGYKGEGGVEGTIRVQYGGSSQTLDSYLSAHLGSDQPAYRGFTGAIFERLYVGTTTYLKTPWFVVKRVSKHPNGDAIWYPAKASIVLDSVTGAPHLNAVHFLRERLTDGIYGLGKSPLDLGATWDAAADTCYAEGYGISNIFDSETDSIEDVMQQVEEIIDAKVYVNPVTGKFELGLVRADYAVEELEAFDESDFWVESLSIPSPGNMASRTIVKWYDRSSREVRPAYASDIALLARQGSNALVQTLDYSAFLCSRALATKIAAREQDQIAAMPCRLTLRGLRTMSHLHETRVIRISYPALNITTMVVRVVSISRGSLADGECVLEVVEDVFGQVYTVYGPPPASAASSPTVDEGDRLTDQGTIEAAASAVGIESGPY